MEKWNIGRAGKLESGKMGKWDSKKVEQREGGEVEKWESGKVGGNGKIGLLVSAVRIKQLKSEKTTKKSREWPSTEEQH